MTELPVIKVLLVEDNPGDVKLIQTYLADATDVRFVIEHTGHLMTALTHMKDPTVDIVVLDLGLPDSSGLSTFRSAHNENPDIPIVVLTGLDIDRLGLKAVQEGAQDFLMKAGLTAERLIMALLFAIERHARGQAGE